MAVVVVRSLHVTAVTKVGCFVTNVLCFKYISEHDSNEPYHCDHMHFLRHSPGILISSLDLTGLDLQALPETLRGYIMFTHLKNM